MAKLTMFYTAMNGGKTAALLQVAHNYEENGQKVLVLKSEKDSKGNDTIVSRLGISRKVDIILKDSEKILSKKYQKKIYDADCIMVDEVQFLDPEQVDELYMITKELNMPVICYGLKTNFKGEFFSGAKRVFELADNIKELDMIPLCECGEKARFNARKEDGKYRYVGEEIVIDGSNHIYDYVPLCGKCYFEKVYKKGLRWE